MIEAGNIVAILLAAGRSQRFGAADKLLAPLDGEPLLVHAARRLVELAPARLIAVCAGASVDILTRLGFEIVINPHPERGLSHSLALGIAEAGAAQAALIALGDMPFVSPAHLRNLLARFDPASAPVVASAREGGAMPPALFARAHFERLRQLQGDTGGRALLAGAALVEAPASELADIDRPEDLPRKSTSGI